jgi:hypothetical protein
MSLPRVQFTIGGLMIVIAYLAAAFAFRMRLVKYRNTAPGVQHGVVLRNEAPSPLDSDAYGRTSQEATRTGEIARLGR